MNYSSNNDDDKSVGTDYNYQGNHNADDCEEHKIVVSDYKGKYAHIFDEVVFVPSEERKEANEEGQEPDLNDGDYCGNI